MEGINFLGIPRGVYPIEETCRSNRSLMGGVVSPTIIPHSLLVEVNPNYPFKGFDKCYGFCFEKELGDFSLACLRGMPLCDPARAHHYKTNPSDDFQLGVGDILCL